MTTEDCAVVDAADYSRDSAPSEVQSVCGACGGLGKLRVMDDDGKRRASDGWRKCLDCNGTGQVLDGAATDDGAVGAAEGAKSLSSERSEPGVQGSGPGAGVGGAQPPSGLELVRLAVEDGCLENQAALDMVPRTTWIATVTPDRRSPGGLTRRFWNKGMRGWYERPGVVVPGDVLEMAGDLRNPRKKFAGRDRVYWFVTSVSAACLEVVSLGTTPPGRRRIERVRDEVARAYAKDVSDVVGAVVVHEGRVLLTQRPAGKTFAFAWEFPGGKVEPEEEPREALRRELGEEIECADAEVEELPIWSGHVHSAGVTVSFYLATLRGVPVPKEGQGIGWFAPEELERQTLTPGNQVALPAVLGYLTARCLPVVRSSLIDLDIP